MFLIIYTAFSLQTATRYINLIDLQSFTLGVREKGNGETEENFDEAVKAVNTCLLPTSIPSGVQSLLNEASTITPSPSTKSFWIMARALHEFIFSEGGGVLPVRGIIPDMTADSEKYIKLQNL